MIKKIYIICFTLFSLFLNIALLKSQTNKFLSTVFDSPLKKSEFLLYLAKNYSSNAFSILDKKDYDFYTKWANGKGHNEVLCSYATVIHETCHSVNDDIGGFWGNGFYISPKIEIKVSPSDVFKSSEIDKNIPKSWKSNIFRYKTYIQGIEGDKEISSIGDGIYGLMDEFDAYYQSTRAVVELYDYYKTLAICTDPYYWTLYISNCYSSIYAYYEFRLFIAWYLKYARKNYPDIYRSIIQNKELRAVFTLIDIAYEKVINQYFTNRNKILENINKASRKKAEISEKYFLVITQSKKGNTWVGYGIPDSEIKYLNSILTIEDFQILKSFGIENLNETNYKSFLE